MPNYERRDRDRREEHEHQAELARIEQEERELEDEDEDDEPERSYCMICGAWDGGHWTGCPGGQVRDDWLMNHLSDQSGIPPMDPSL